MCNKSYNLQLNELETTLVSQSVLELLERTDDYISRVKISEDKEEVDTITFHFSIVAELMQMVFAHKQTQTISYTKMQWDLALIALDETIQKLQHPQLLSDCQQWLLNKGFHYNYAQITNLHFGLIANIRKTLQSL